MFASEFPSISTSLQIEDHRAILYCQLRKEWRSLGGFGSGIFAGARDIQSRMVRRVFAKSPSGSTTLHTPLQIEDYPAIYPTLYISLAAARRTRNRHGRGCLKETEDGCLSVTVNKFLLYFWLLIFKCGHMEKL